MPEKNKPRPSREAEKFCALNYNGKSAVAICLKSYAGGVDSQANTIENLKLENERMKTDMAATAIALNGG